MLFSYPSCLYILLHSLVIDPYIIVRLHDVKKTADAGQDDMDEIKITECRTSEVKDNGFCPQWKDAEYFEFQVNSDVAMIEFIVMDSDTGFVDDLVCMAAVPVSCLKQGYRSLQLYDRRGSQHGPFDFARIIVDVDIKYN